MGSLGVFVIIVVVAIGFFIAVELRKSQNRSVLSANAELIGKTAVAVDTFSSKGRVKVQGEVWTAICRNGIISAGDSVKIVGASDDLLQLEVEKLSN